MPTGFGAKLRTCPRKHAILKPTEISTAPRNWAAPPRICSAYQSNWNLSPAPRAALDPTPAANPVRRANSNATDESLQARKSGNWGARIGDRTPITNPERDWRIGAPPTGVIETNGPRVYASNGVNLDASRAAPTAFRGEIAPSDQANALTALPARAPNSSMWPSVDTTSEEPFGTSMPLGSMPRPTACKSAWSRPSNATMNAVRTGAEGPKMSHAPTGDPIRNGTSVPEPGSGWLVAVEVRRRNIWAHEAQSVRLLTPGGYSG